MKSGVVGLGELLVANWDQIKKKNRAYQPFLHRGFSPKLHFTEKPVLKLCFLPSEPAIIKDFWNPISTKRTEVFPIQSELHSSDQSEQLHSDE